MNFSQALAYLKEGDRMARSGWNGKGMYIMLVSDCDTPLLTQPYLAFRTAGGAYVPWTASQTDILAEDWVRA